MYDDAQLLQEELVAHRRYLHQHPELGLELFLTSAYVKKKLTEMGYEAVDCGKSGVLATVGGNSPGKVFLLRADMDALPVKEEVDGDYKSTNENMHACGHDFHTTMLLGAAKLLKENEDKIPGTVKLMFQPAEETLLGAKAMIDAGILENPRVDGAMMIHVMSGQPFKSGKVVVPLVGISSAASDWFELHIKGRGGHGASPNKAVDPLNIAAHTHLALQEINSREVHSSEPLALTIGVMEGGRVSNVIPDRALLKGTIRTYEASTREFVKKRVLEISQAMAQVFRGETDARIIEGCPSIINDEDLVNSANKYLVELLGKEEVLPITDVHPSGKSSGSEDFGFLSEVVPTLSLSLAAGNSLEGYDYPIHHPKVRFDESVLCRGAAVYAYMALRWLEEH
ncbi:MAG: amidohydrolase [Tissierellia bacterium]|nr:amidohydrolase [Tissierellia bacterium]